MARYLVTIAAIGIPGTFIGLVLGTLFTHQGGPMFYATFFVVPGYWLAGFVDAHIGPMFWIFGTVFQVGYYFVLSHLFLLWRESRASSA